MREYRSDADRKLGKADLMRIEADDILRTRVFSDVADGFPDADGKPDGDSARNPEPATPSAP